MCTLLSTFAHVDVHSVEILCLTTYTNKSVISPCTSNLIKKACIHHTAEFLVEEEFN